MQGKTLQIEHLGIVAQVMKDIKLIDKIDCLIPTPNADVTLGQRGRGVSPTFRTFLERFCLSTPFGF
jgi:hypothetical protein